MRSGRLNKRVILEQLAGGSPRQSSSGERADTWTEFATVRAFVRPISGKELRAGGQVQGQVDTEIEIRYLEGVVAGMRARWLGAPTVVYTIDAVLDPELRQKKLLLQCQAGVVNV